MKFIWKSFNELSGREIYNILRLRAEIFVVEQECLFLDPDGKDEFALHLQVLENKNLVAYIRLFPPTEIENYLVFGRVVSSRQARGRGYGKALMTELLKYCDQHYPNILIKCSAQHYLKNFYESFGFVAHGDVYQEDNMPHIAMSRE